MVYILLFRKKSTISNKDNENFKPIVFVNNPVKRRFSLPNASAW